MARACCNSMNDSTRISRREMLQRAGLGFGTWALLDLLNQGGRLNAKSIDNPLSPKPHLHVRSQAAFAKASWSAAAGQRQQRTATAIYQGGRGHPWLAANFSQVRRFGL